MTSDERQIEDLLRRSKPAPRAKWLARTERDLFPEPRARQSWFQLPAVRLGSAVTAGLATMLLILGLAGIGPLDGGNGEVRAKETCRLVSVTRTQRIPIVTTAKDGTPRIEYRKRPVKRTVRRCTQR